MKELDIVIDNLTSIADKLKSSWFSFLIPAGVFIKLERATKDLKSANVSITMENNWNKNEIKRLKALLPPEKKMNILSEKSVIAIYNSKGTNKDVAELFNVSAATVSRIRNSKSHTKITKNLTR